MKLSYKIFLVNLIVSFFLIFLMGGVARFYAVKHFKEKEVYLLERDLSELSSALGLVYSEKGSWESLNGTPRAFEHFLRNLDIMPHGPMNHQDEPPPGLPRHPPPPDRFVLLNPDKRWVAGPRIPVDELRLGPIQFQGEIVGWVGIIQGPGPQTPPLDAQLNTLYTISVIVFLLTGGVSWLLGRYILSPIDQVTRGTKALADFKFDTRIKVKTGDELGLLATDFNRMARTLQKYEDMKTQWLMDIAHELRTPVCILKGEIEAIRDGIRAPSPRRIISLYEEVVHLEKIIQDLHLLSAADAKIVAMRRDPVQPVDILGGVLFMYEAKFEQAGLGLEQDLEAQDAIVLGSKDRLKQLFCNILENNLRYTKRPGKIYIKARDLGDQVTISILDSGPGVPDQSIDRLFERLFRVDRSRSRRLGGTGLGLSICKAIVDAHKGRIHAANKSDQGLEISIGLPKV